VTLAVDTSVLVAIALNQPERSVFIDRIQSATEPVVSAVSVLEAGIVLSVRLRGFATADLTSLVDGLGLTVRPFDQPQADLALAAYRRFGKGFNPRARLNLGDAIAYALAVREGLPLLFKGEDFAATDIRPA
jgi:ribonuclease VapC